MSLFKKRPKTAQQKAQRAQMRIVLRVFCCAYMVFYIIIPLLREAPEEDNMNPTLRFVIVAAFIAFTAVILVISVIDFYRSWKAGLFKAEAYEDDEVDEVSGVRDQVSGGEGDEVSGVRGQGTRCQGSEGEGDEVSVDEVSGVRAQVSGDEGDEEDIDNGG